MNSIHETRTDIARMRGRTRALLGHGLTSPTLHVTALLGVSGVAFALGNLLLARFLSPESYAVVALAVTLIALGTPIAPVGLDGLVIRKALSIDSKLLGRVVWTASASGVVAALAAWLLYDFDLVLSMLVLLGVVSGGLTHLASSRLQSLERFRISVFVAQCSNFFLLSAAVIMIVRHRGGILFPLAAVAAGQLLIAAWAWRNILANPEHVPGTGVFPWAEALSLAGITGAAILLVQLERLIVPKLLGLEALATYGVLASIVIAPFRVLQLGAGKTLFPVLRNATTVRMRRRVLVKETAVVAGVVVLVSPVIWFATPPLVSWLLQGKYDVSAGLLAAAIVTGTVKLGTGIANAAVTALGDRRRIVWWNLASWAAVALAVLGGSVGSRWGLPGLMYGVAAAWLGRSLVGAWLAVPYLRREARSFDRPGG